MKYRNLRIAGLIGLIIVLTYALSHAHEAPVVDGNKATYKGKVYTYKGSGRSDINKDKVKETTVSRYDHTSNIKIYRLNTVKGVFAWGIYLNRRDKSDKINNYSIVDTTGDGVFDTIYPRGTDIPPPVWLGLAPDLTGFNHDRVKWLDKSDPEDGVKETKVYRQKNAEGHKILRYTYNGITWAWGRLISRDPKDIANNYVIVDTNCDGTFDTRYAANEDFYLPECFK